MIIQKPALININGPPLTEFGHSSFLNKTLEKPKSTWQQVPINLYKNPKLEKTLREFLAKQ